MNSDLKTLENELKYVQNKQQQRIIHSANLQLNLTTTTNNLADRLKSLKNEFNTFQTKQQDIINRDINILRSNLRVTTNNLANRIDTLDHKLNSTQEKQQELISDLLNHGHGNKQRLDQLESQMTNFTSDFESFDQQIKTVQQKQITFISQDVLDRKINDSMTNVTFYMNQIERQAFENITDLSSQMNSTTKKIGLLWLNFLDGKNLISPLLVKYGGNNYADSIGASNKTEALRKEIERLVVNETTEYKRIVTDRIPNSFSVKLHPIDSNLKKVKYSFTVQPFARNKLYFTLGIFDGEA